MLFKDSKWRPLAKAAMVLALAAPAAGWATVARMQTSLGVIDIQLYDKQTPLTVANFLKYVNAGRYDNTIIHRSIPGFIVQGGDIYYDAKGTAKYVDKYPAVKNEYSPSRSNLRGTIAMAKVDKQPDSATSDWFFNLADNSANLDNQNGGFTVFGKVLGDGMRAVDAVAALPGPGSKFQALVYGVASDIPLKQELVNGRPKLNPIILSKVSTAQPSKTSDADRVFGYLEGLYPVRFAPANVLSPATGVSKTGSGYYYRYYATTKKYLATKSGNVYWGAALNSGMAKIGTVSGFLATAADRKSVV